VLDSVQVKKKKSRKLPTTPRSKVKNALRQLWLRSRERASAIKREGNTCEICHVKGSVAKGREVKINVHHKEGIDWDGIVDLVIERVLQSPEKLQVLCVDCHDKEHNERI
jgi:predicted HNH restriction endonuclease